MKRWEYKRVTPLIVTLFEKQLNSLGAHGWELCGKDGAVYIFKREKVA